MRHTIIGIIWVAVMIALIVGVDVAFLRDRFVLRLIVNVSIVVVLAATYIALRKHL